MVLDYRMWSWLRGGWLFWSVPLVFVGAIAVIVACESERCIRVVGLGLQTLGMMLAVKGLLDVRSTLGFSSLREDFRKWLDAFPGRRPSKVFGSPVAAGTASTEARAEVWTSARDASLEARVHALEQNLNTLRGAMGSVRKDLVTLEGEIRCCRALANASFSQVRSELAKVKTVHERGFHESLFGLLLLLVGMGLSTLSQELSAWF